MSSAFHLSPSSSSVNPWLPSPQNMKRPWRWWWKSSLKRLTSQNPDLQHTQWKNLPWSSFASSPLSLSSGQRKRKFYHFRNFVRVPICGNLLLVYSKSMVSFFDSSIFWGTYLSKLRKTFVFGPPQGTQILLNTATHTVLLICAIRKLCQLCHLLN